MQRLMICMHVAPHVRDLSKLVYACDDKSVLICLRGSKIHVCCNLCFRYVENIVCATEIPRCPIIVCEHFARAWSCWRALCVHMLVLLRLAAPPAPAQTFELLYAPHPRPCSPTQQPQQSLQFILGVRRLGVGHLDTDLGTHVGSCLACLSHASPAHIGCSIAYYSSAGRALIQLVLARPGLHPHRNNITSSFNRPPPNGNTSTTPHPSQSPRPCHYRLTPQCRTNTPTAPLTFQTWHNRVSATRPYRCWICLLLVCSRWS